MARKEPKRKTPEAFYFVIEELRASQGQLQAAGICYFIFLMSFMLDVKEIFEIVGGNPMLEDFQRQRWIAVVIALFCYGAGNPLWGFMRLTTGFLVTWATCWRYMKFSLTDKEEDERHWLWTTHPSEWMRGVNLQHKSVQSLVDEFCSIVQVALWTASLYLMYFIGAGHEWADFWFPFCLYLGLFISIRELRKAVLPFMPFIATLGLGTHELWTLGLWIGGVVCTTNKVNRPWALTAVYLFTLTIIQPEGDYFVPVHAALSLLAILGNGGHIKTRGRLVHEVTEGEVAAPLFLGLGTTFFFYQEGLWELYHAYQHGESVFEAAKHVHWAHVHYGSDVSFPIMGILSSAVFTTQMLSRMLGKLLTGLMFLTPVPARYRGLADRCCVAFVLFLAFLVGCIAGEAAAREVALAFIGERVEIKRMQKALKYRLVFNLALALSVSAGVLWFAAPPVAVISGQLQMLLGWVLMTLAFLTGTPCLIYKIWCAWVISHPDLLNVDGDTPVRRVCWQDVQWLWSKTCAIVLAPFRFIMKGPRAWVRDTVWFVCTPRETWGWFITTAIAVTLRTLWRTLPLTQFLAVIVLNVAFGIKGLGAAGFYGLNSFMFMAMYYRERKILGNTGHGVWDPLKMNFLIITFHLIGEILKPAIIAMAGALSIHEMSLDVMLLTAGTISFLISRYADNAVTTAAMVTFARFILEQAGVQAIPQPLGPETLDAMVLSETARMAVVLATAFITTVIVQSLTAGVGTEIANPVVNFGVAKWAGFEKGEWAKNALTISIFAFITGQIYCHVCARFIMYWLL